MYSLAYRCSLGYPSNGVKDHTFLPLFFFFFFLKLWLTSKSAQSVRSGYACRKGMMVAPWTYTLYAQTWFAVYMAAEQRSRCGSATSSCALTRVQSGNRNLDTKTKDGSVSKHTTRPELMRALVLQLLPQVLWSFVCAPFIHHLFPGQPKPVYSRLHTHTHTQPTSKQSIKNHSEICSLFKRNMMFANIKCAWW